MADEPDAFGLLHGAVHDPGEVRPVRMVRREQADRWRERIIERTLDLVVSIHEDTGMDVDLAGAIVAAAAIGASTHHEHIARRLGKEVPHVAD